MGVFYFDAGYDTAGHVVVESIPDPGATILDNNGPYRCTIVPDDPLLPTETTERNEHCGWLAGTLAVEKWKEKNNLNPSTVWTFTS